METVNLLRNHKRSLLTTQDISRLTGIEVKRTLENNIRRLIEKNILISLEKGKYMVAESDVSDFEIANFLYSPSYISFETALNYHGILSQFPFEITSATSKKSKKKEILGKTYRYIKINKRLYMGYYKSGNCLIAYPEKALFDYLYMVALKKKSEEYLNEMDFSNIKKRGVEEYLPLLSSKSKKEIILLISKYL